MDRVTRAKLDSLVHALRTCGREQLGSVEALARRLQLDPMIVRRVAEQQGITLGETVEPTADADPNQSTQVMSVDAVFDEL